VHEVAASVAINWVYDTTIPVSAIDEFASTVGGPWESRGYIGSQSSAGAQTNT
jgi:hypothetical protein